MTPGVSPHQPRPTPRPHPSPWTVMTPWRSPAARRPIAHVAGARPGGGDAQITAKPTRGRGLQGPDQPVYPFPGPWFPQDPHLIGRGVLGGRGGHLEASCSVPPTPDIPPPALHSLAPPTASPVSPSQLPLTRPGLALVPSDWRLGGQGGPEGREIWRWRDA